MDKLSQTSNWIDQAVSIWTSKGIKLQSGVSLDKISDFEKLLDFKFPQDFLDLYTKVNGFEDFDWNEHMFSLWSLDRILKEYKEEGDTNYIGFCDYLINSHSIGFFKTEAGIYKSYDQMKSIADSVRDAVFLINSNSDLIY